MSYGYGYDVQIDLDAPIPGFDPHFDPTARQPIAPGYYNALLFFAAPDKTVEERWLPYKDGSGLYCRVFYQIESGPFRNRIIDDFLSTRPDKFGNISAHVYLASAGLLDLIEANTARGLRDAVEEGILQHIPVGISVDQKAREKSEDGTYSTLYWSADKFPRDDRGNIRPDMITPVNGGQVYINAYIKRVGRARKDD